MVRAFVWGVIEFRSSLTRHYESPRKAEAYDLGRELAHLLTLRRYED